LQGWTIEVDLDLCIGSGECVGWAPEAFVLGPHDTTVRILPTAATADLDAVKDAALSCPTGAILLVSPDGATFP
jgi:ferredoxin